MNKTRIIIAVLIFTLFVGIVNASGWNWTNPLTTGFQDAYNITVNNWNYTSASSYMPQNTFNTIVGYTLVQVNIINPENISILGYNNANQLIGNITYSIPYIVGNSVELLVKNRTDQGLLWNTATVYYNPLPNYLSLLCTAEVTCTYGGGSGNFTYLAGFGSDTFKGVNFIYLYNLSSAQNINSNPYYSTSSNAFFNFTLDSNYRNFEVIANRTVNNIAFNTSWSLPSYTFIISAYQGNYILKATNGAPTLGLFANYLTNSPVVSASANILFSGRPFDGIGYQAFFSKNNPQQFSGEGLSVCYPLLGIFICNATLTRKVEACFLTVSCNPQYTYSMSVSTSEPITFYILPAFTINNIVSNPIVNPSPTTNFSQGEQRGFQDKELVNLTWNYVFNTIAYPNNNGNTVTLDYKDSGVSNNVTYAIVNFTKYATLMGSSCQYIYLDDYNNVTRTEYGEVPYYLLNYSGTQCSILIPEHTLEGHFINSFWIYFNPYIPGYGSESSNAMVYSSWIVNSITSNGLFTVNSINPALEIKFGTPFVKNDYISAFTQSGGQIGIYENNTAILPASGSLDYYLNYVYDHTNNPNQVFVINQTYLSSYKLVNLFGHALSVTPDGLGDYYGSNSTLTQGVCNVSTTVCDVFTKFTVNVSNSGGGAQANYLYTTNYTIGQVIAIKLPLCDNVVNGKCENIIYPNITVTVPQTTNGLNYNVTSTIDFNPGGNSIFLANGVSFPKYYLLMVAIIFELIGLGMLGIGELGHFGFYIMFFGIWLIGFFAQSIPFYAVLVLATILFVFYEWVIYKKVS